MLWKSTFLLFSIVCVNQCEISASVNTPSTTQSTPTATTVTTARPQQIDFDFDSTEPPSFSALNNPLSVHTGLPSNSTTTMRSPLPKAATADTNGEISSVHSNGTRSTVHPCVGNEGSFLVTDDELRSLGETLYTEEVNSQFHLITVKPQGKTTSNDSTDEAPQPFFEVDPKAFDAPTIAKMRLLFNNYEEDISVSENVSAVEHEEENDFVDAVMATNVMRQAMLFLQNKGVVSPDPKTHRDMLKELWFTQNSRGSGNIGSSAFEHVFLHEVKNGTLIGLHNWVYFHDEEQAGRMDYKGYLKELDLGTKTKAINVRATHNGLNKPINTLLIGTSPELELALYTVCFKLKPDQSCPVSFANNRFEIVTYSRCYGGKSVIATAYSKI